MWGVSTGKNYTEKLAGPFPRPFGGAGGKNPKMRGGGGTGGGLDEDHCFGGVPYRGVAGAVNLTIGCRSGTERGRLQRIQKTAIR